MRAQFARIGWTIWPHIEVLLASIVVFCFVVGNIAVKGDKKVRIECRWRVDEPGELGKLT